MDTFFFKQIKKKKKEVKYTSLLFVKSTTTVRQAVKEVFSTK